VTTSALVRCIAGDDILRIRIIAHQSFCVGVVEIIIQGVDDEFWLDGG
jgi:hypothetical protein